MRGQSHSATMALPSSSRRPLSSPQHPADIPSKRQGRCRVPTLQAQTLGFRKVKCLDQGHMEATRPGPTRSAWTPVQCPLPPLAAPSHTRRTCVSAQACSCDTGARGASTWRPRAPGPHHTHNSIPAGPPPQHAHTPTGSPCWTIPWPQEGPCCHPALPPWGKPFKAEGTCEPSLCPPLNSGSWAEHWAQRGDPSLPHLPSHGLTLGPWRGTALGARDLGGGCPKGMLGAASSQNGQRCVPNTEEGETETRKHQKNICPSTLSLNLVSQPLGVF